MHHTHCLNCNASLSGKFCSNCGQKADTHRITLKHFVQHDLLHGVWHIERGILFTLKEIFTRPGIAATDYISGKRIRYYNIFYLLLLVIGLNLVVVHYAQKLSAGGHIEATGDGIALQRFLEEHTKFIVLSIIPFFAFNGWLIFRRLKLNIAEHAIIAGFALLGCATIALAVNLFKLAQVKTGAGFFGDASVVLLLVMSLFPAWAYYLASRPRFKFGGYLWRIILFYIIFLIEIILEFIVFITITSGGNFEGSFTI